MRSVGVDVSIAPGILMFIWAKPKAALLCFFIGPQSGMIIPSVIVSSVVADVSIAPEILMFIWAKPKAELSCFLLVPRLT